MKLLVFTRHFWLKRLRGINNSKNDNKHEIKQQMQHKIKENLKVKLIVDPK